MLGAPPRTVKEAIDTILTSWKSVEDERVSWHVEKARMESKLKMYERANRELVEKIKKLEFSLKNKNGVQVDGVQKESGLGSIKTNKKVKWKTLPTCFPKQTLKPERIREIVEDLMASANSSTLFLDGSKIDHNSEDATVLQPDDDIKEDNPIKSPAPRKEAQKVELADTGAYKKLKALEVKKLRGWVGACPLRSHLDGVRSISFHPELPLLFSCAEDGTAKLWNMERLIRKRKPQKKQEPVVTLRGHVGMATCTAATKNMLYTAGVDGNVFAHEYPKSDQNQYTPYGSSFPFRVNTFSHGDAVWSVCANENFVFTACADGIVSMWEAGNHDQKAPKSKFISSDLIPTSVAMNVSGERLLVSYTSGDLGIFDIETGKQTSLIKGTGYQAMQITAHPFLDLGIAAVCDGSYHILDILQGKRVDIKKNAHTDVVTSISMDNDGVALATASHDQSIRIWDVRKLSVHILMDANQHRKKFDEAIHCVKHHPKLPLMASGGADSVVKVFIESQ